jgi:tRNA A-37 threonylcarbamoyl transferase component Bud32/tetratricopeptide (TPR) repeat protein
MTDEAGPKAPLIKELSGRIGKYDIVKPLGKGAMGMVYLAHDTVLERDVALKVMVAQIADDPELKTRFEREARAVAKMTHPNVVTVFDLGNHVDGSPFIAMELLKGQDLQKAIRQPPPMTLERKVTIIVQVLAGLAHAHQAGIVHRDIKPANIFINQDGTVKIMDFGVARLTTASMTGTGNIVGTADYMSPEQVKGSRVDGRSDVFSVGCMLYELLTGRRPFHSENLMAIFYKITHEEPNFDLIPAGPEFDALLPILQKSLDKDLEKRYPTAYDFAMDLKGWLQTNATTASGEHALASLLDMEAPTHPPQPMTDPRGPTMVDGTVDLGSSAAARARPVTGTGRTSATVRPGTAAGTVRPGTAATGSRGAVTVVDGGTMPGTLPGPRPGTGRTTAPPATVVRPQRLEPRRAAPAPSGSSPWLYVALGGLAVALLAAGGYIYVQKQKAEVAQLQASPSLPSPSPVAAMPPPTEAPPTPAPATAAPPPTFAEATGKSAVAMRAAQGAFKKGDYDRALASAQQALKEDPDNKGAEKLAANAMEGQKAGTRARQAQAALDKGDFATAEAEALAANKLAPWDDRFTGLINRVRETQASSQREAQAREQRDAAAREQQQKQAAVGKVNDLLARADDALNKGQFDAAIQLYDESSKLDPGNSRAASGKTSAIGARALAQAAGAGGLRGAGKAFVSGKTQAQSVETSAANAPPGFEESAGVSVKRGSAAAELPGKIQFEAKPEAVKAGDPYSVSIYLVNEGAGPISVKAMAVSIVKNGGRAGGPVQPLTKDVAPRQKALLLATPTDMWKEDTAAWQMEVTVSTARGETYKNTLSWK